jgi:quercetin dioxygenase-like cupin family protein
MPLGNGLDILVKECALYQHSSVRVVRLRPGCIGRRLSGECLKPKIPQAAENDPYPAPHPARETGSRATSRKIRVMIGLEPGHRLKLCLPTPDVNESRRTGMIRKLALGATALALTLAGSTPFAAENNGYVPTRTILQQTDVPGSNYTVVLALTDIKANMTAARHTHPGVEVSYVLAGAADFVIDGVGVKHLKAGDNFRLESGVKHSVKNGPADTKILAVYTIPKGAALATPAPE